jgi:hypothetical protein
MLLPSILSEAAPNYSRTLPALPALFVAVGLGLTWLVAAIPRWLTGTIGQRWATRAGYGLATLLVLVSGSWAGYDYFVRYPQLPASYYAYDVDKLDALAALEDLAAQGNTIYLAPLWSEHATFAFLRDTTIIKALDSGETLVLPPAGQGAVYAFPAEALDRAADLAREWEGVDAVLLNDHYDKPLLAIVHVPAAQLADWPRRYEPTPPDADLATDLPAHFDDAPTLLGLQQRNDNRELRLFWQAEAPTLRNLTNFLHFVDQDGRRVAQVDKLPGDGTYLTPTWSPGERVIERYDAEIQDLCANGDPLTLIVGWYEFAADGARRPRLDAAGNSMGDSAIAGRVTFPISAHAPVDLPLPMERNLTIADDLTLYGYAINDPTNGGEPFRPGTPFTIGLFWQVSDALNHDIVKLQLRNADAAIVLWQAIMAPDVPWHPGELICRRAHAIVPDHLTPGNYQLELQANGGASVPLHTLAVAEK